MNFPKNDKLELMIKLIKTIIPLIIFGVAAYFFRSQLFNLWIQLNHTYFPCAQPISYSIGTFDTKFGISKDQFLSALNKAEQIWEKPIDKDLFTYTDDGPDFASRKIEDPRFWSNQNRDNLKINLIYDYRQEATIKLQKLGLVINDDKATYESLKSKYKAMQSAYNQKLILFKSQLAIFETHKNTYEKEVAYWNKRGGATPKAYAQLTDAKNALDAELAQLNKLQDELNTDIDNINAMITVLNRLAESLNIDATEFNQTNEARGDEFEEGLYQSGPDGQTIDIYQFDNTDKLIRVLTHELGHALGLDHLENPKAIMYRLNQGTNTKLTADDVSALKTLCKVK